MLLCCSLAGMAAEGFYYQPANGWCGDPMPFYDVQNQLFRVCYLQEFRPNDYATYHPVYALETKDMVHYTELGEVLPTGDRWALDAAIGTGSVIWCEAQQKYYFFYTGNKFQPGQDVRSGCAIRYFDRWRLLDENQFPARWRSGVLLPQ